MIVGGGFLRRLTGRRSGRWRSAYALTALMLVAVLGARSAARRDGRRR